MGFFMNVCHYTCLVTRSLTHSSKMAHCVFVYGTLKRNEPNHHWLTNPENGASTYRCEGTTKTKYPLIIGTKYNIPFLLDVPGTGYHVRGEIYEVDDLMLSKLDMLEGHPIYYVRSIDVIQTLDKKRTINCWVYFLKTFRKDLQNNPHLETYSSTGNHGLEYTESTETVEEERQYVLDIM